MPRTRFCGAPWILIGLLVVACGGGESEEAAAPATTATEAAEQPTGAAGTPPAATDPPATTAPDAGSDEPEATAAEGEEPELEESDLVHGGTVSIKEYSVAFIGSGSLGKGTLTAGGAAHPFRIGGLGIGGIGIASIDASGNVYNLHDLSDFTGAYGKARVGLTIADKGQGRLWLKNTKGVVIELWTEMAGLALTGGVDGIAVEWEDDYQRGLQEVKDAPEKAWEGTKKGAQSAVDAVKKPFE